MRKPDTLGGDSFRALCKTKEAPLKVILEYVSANPTGPIHVGHGRGAVIGSSLANILAFQNYDIQTEYYINDSGRQMDILALSVIHKFNDRKIFKVMCVRGSTSQLIWWRHQQIK